MRHRKKGRKFGLKRNQRKALLKGLAHNLIIRGKILTTEAKAKELRSLAERLITYGKKQNPGGLRLILKHLPKISAYKIYNEIAKRHGTRKGGYTKITKIFSKRRDGAKIARIELL